MSRDVSAGLRSAIFHALRAAFRVLPVDASTRDALRQRFLDRFPAIRPAPTRGLTSGDAPYRPRFHAGGRALDYVHRSDAPLPEPKPATLVAFYLPQFHTIPENDAWWGKGFTEWRNVARALPQFEGHAQPRLPGELGFYDLRNPQVLRDQAELARDYGLGAFCMYFYWFGGRTLLELPHRQWLADPAIDFPICLCWANENWTRTWDGRAGEVLIAQRHSAEDDLAFVAHVAPYLRDPRYLRIDGKPLLLVYRPGLLPEPAATAARWRAWCRDNGIGEICLGYTQSFERPDPRDIGFDVAIEFPPNMSTPGNLTACQALINADYSGDALDWRDLAHEYSQRPLPPYPLFPGVNCGWDNESRRPGRGRTFLHASPSGYARWLGATIHERLAQTEARDRVVFINAWNEWAEGAALEPDARHGHAWLEATRTALQGAAVAADGPPCLAIHAWYPDLLGDILDAVMASGIRWQAFVTTGHDQEAAVRAMLESKGCAAEVITGGNRGRDILPFLSLLHTLQRRGYDGPLLKLHTKCSTHREDGSLWRGELLRSLLEPVSAQRVLAAFRNDPTLGLVVPAGHLLEAGAFEGANTRGLEFVVRLAGLGPAPASHPFAAGSMYYARLSALRALVEADFAAEQFEDEAGQIDGTLAHAVERIVGRVVTEAGFRIAALEPDGELTAPKPRKRYRYAGPPGA